MKSYSKNSTTTSPMCARLTLRNPIYCNRTMIKWKILGSDAHVKGLSIIKSTQTVTKPFKEHFFF